MWLQRVVGSATGKETTEVQCREVGGCSVRYAKGDTDSYIHTDRCIIRKRKG